MIVAIGDSGTLFRAVCNLAAASMVHRLYQWRQSDDSIAMKLVYYRAVDCRLYSSGFVSTQCTSIRVFFVSLIVLLYAAEDYAWFIIV